MIKNIVVQVALPYGYKGHGITITISGLSRDARPALLNHNAGI